MNTNTPAGWYPDQSAPGYERYWDGNEWTANTRPSPISDAPPAPNMNAQFAETQPKAKKGGCFGMATGLVVGVFLAFGLLFVGCVAIFAAGSSDDGGNVSIDTSAPGEPADAEQSADAEQPAIDETSDEGEPAEVDEELPESADIVGCVRTSENEVELELVNNSSKTSTYSLTVGFFDEAGARVADESSFVNHLRPGERAILPVFTFESAGATCEVIDVDRFAAESQADEVPDVAPCEVTGESVLGDIEATVSATNSSENTSSYVIQVAFVDADGIRRGDGTVFIEAVRPNEAAPGDIFTSTDFDAGLSCEVVGVDRTQS